MSTHGDEVEIDFATAKQTQEDGAQAQDAGGMTEPVDESVLVNSGGMPTAPISGSPLSQPAAYTEPTPPTPPHPGIDQNPESEWEKQVAEKIAQEEEEERDPQDILKELGLRYEPKTVKLGIPGTPGYREYVQKPLTFIGKIKTFALLGEVIDKAMGGSNPIQLKALMEVPDGRGGKLTIEDFRDAEVFVQAVGKIVMHMPDFIERAFIIWLNVPDFDREVVELALKAPENEGGLSTDEAFDIIATFIDQNWDELEGFFTGKLAKLGQRVSARLRVTQSRRSKQ